MNNDEKNKTIRLLTIGFILSFFFSIPGLIVCIIGIIKAKEKEVKEITLGIIGVVLSLIKIIIITLFVFFFIKYSDNIRNILSNYYNVCPVGYDCSCGEFDEYCECTKCFDSKCHIKVKVSCPNKDRNIY